MSEAFATLLVAVLAWGILVERRLSGLQADMRWVKSALRNGGFEGSTEP